MKRTPYRAALALLSMTAVGALGCTGKASGDQVEKKIIEWAKSMGVEITKATCPKSIKVEVDATFECKTQVAGGEELTVQGTVTSKSGKNFEYSIKVVEPTYFAEKAAAYLDDALTQQVGVKPKSVDCGPPGIHKIPADLKITCVATDPEDHATKITFVFKADGTVDTWAAE